MTGFLGNFFMAILIYSQRFCNKSAERKSPKKYVLHFILTSEARTLALSLLSQHTTHYTTAISVLSINQQQMFGKQSNFTCQFSISVPFLNINQYLRYSHPRTLIHSVYTRCDQKITVILKFHELHKFVFHVFYLNVVTHVCYIC